MPPPRRRTRLVLAVAVSAFVAQGWFFTGAQIVWHEEVAVHAAPPSVELSIENGVAREVVLCDGHSWFEFGSHRPHLVLCAAGLAWPILVTPYIGSVHYWPLQLLRPLHHGDPVALRRIALVFGVLALVVLFLLVERVGDSLRAAASVSVAAVLPAFVIVHSLLVLYELIPSLLIACSALVVASRPDPTVPLSPLRAAAAGAIVGLAVLANVKAAVIALPLLAFALHESPILRHTSRRAWLAAALSAALVVSPMAVAALLDPQHGFDREVSRRFAIAASRLDPRLLAAEFWNANVFAADLGFFLDLASGGDGNLWLSTLLVPVLAFAYSVIALVRSLRRLPHDGVAGACGAVLVFYVIFVWLAYNQKPASNYTPVIDAQATSIGCAIVAVGRLFARRGRSLLAGLALAAVIAIVPLVANTYRRGDPRDFMTLSINLEAIRALGDHLRHTPGRPVIVTSYNLAGLPDALTGKPSLRLDRALESCSRDANAETCEREAVGAAIEAVPGARFLVPLHTGVIDKPSAHRVLKTIEEAAALLGARVREEARFETARGVPVLALVVVERERGAGETHTRVPVVAGDRQS